MSTTIPGTGSRSWPELLSSLLRGHDLAADQTAWAMDQVMTGDATPAQVAGFAVALRAKGETPVEVEGLVEAMLRHAVRVRVDGAAVDTCGTGGDRSSTVNISTMAALVVAGAGGRVVKHGNRAASSACGSADLLEELGVPVDLGAAAVAECVDRVGIGFCFAPLFHPALRFAAAPRRELGVPTVFNFLGPLANPAQPPAQAVGVADAAMAPVLAGVLAGRRTSALVFRGEDGLDELTTSAPSRVWEVRDGRVRLQQLDPLRLGVPRAEPEDLRGGDAPANAEVARRFLSGERGPVRDAVLLNAAAALVALDAAAPPAAGRAGVPDEGRALAGEEPAPLEDRLASALRRAGDAVDSGAAAAALDAWVELSSGLTARSSTGPERPGPRC